MQASIATSKLQLGADWQQHYLTSPIWRFWLGSEICGNSVIGAIMPSMDQVGRYFPLTVQACADTGEDVDPPETDAQESWFEALEDFLLKTLEPELPFESVRDALSTFAAPRMRSNERSGEAPIVMRVGSGGFSESFGTIRLAHTTRFCAGTSFWWTAGGVEYDPVAIACKGMPDPTLFTQMLTGRFDVQPDTHSRTEGA